MCDLKPYFYNLSYKIDGRYFSITCRIDKEVPTTDIEKPLDLSMKKKKEATEQWKRCYFCDSPTNVGKYNSAVKYHKRMCPDCLVTCIKMFYKTRFDTVRAAISLLDLASGQNVVRRQSSAESRGKFQTAFSSRRPRSRVSSTSTTRSWQSSRVSAAALLQLPRAISPFSE